MGLSAPPTSLFMTVHPLQGGLGSRLPLSSMTCPVRVIPERDHKFGFFSFDEIAPKRRSFPDQLHARVTTEEFDAVRSRAAPKVSRQRLDADKFCARFRLTLLRGR